MITRWRFWSTVLSLLGWCYGLTQLDAMQELLLFAHLCLSICTETWDGTLLYFIGKKSNSRSKLTGRQMCESNSGNIHIIEAPAVSHQHHWTYCCSATFDTFCKSCRTNKAAQLKHSAIAQKAGSGETGRSLGCLLGSVVRGNSARDADSPENGSMGLMVTGTNGPENKNTGN